MSTSEAVPVRIPDVELYGYADRIPVCPGAAQGWGGGVGAPRRLTRMIPGGGEVFSVGSVNWAASLGWDAGASNVDVFTTNVLRTMLGRDLATVTIGPASHGSSRVSTTSGAPVAPGEPLR